MAGPVIKKEADGSIQDGGGGQVFADDDAMERTFMGGIGLSSRTGLFVVIGLACLAIGAFGLFWAQRDLATSRTQLADAYELAGLVGNVEASVWRIRAANSGQTAGAAKDRLGKVVKLGRMLDEIYKRPDTAGAGEYIATIRQAIAQYARTYRAGTSGAEKADPTYDATLVRALLSVATGLENRVAGLKINGLIKTVAKIRKAEALFIKNGRAENLVTIENQQRAFARLLSMAPLSRIDIADLRKRMSGYQMRLNEYARSRLSRPGGALRRDEIFSYITPSVDGLRKFANQRLAASIRNEAALRDFYLPLIASVGAGLLLLVLLTGTLIMRSIARPIIAAAQAGRRLADGETEVIIRGLGNEDETGDIARAFSTLKVKLLELGELRDSLKKATAEAERGRAATEEAAWLRHDLESQKAELDKGQAAIEEVELLHKVVEATRSNFLENADDNRPPDKLSGDDAPALQPPASTGRELETPDLNTISEISQRVAQSSQNVIAAAAEAEQTGTLIHDLNDAFKRIMAIESSLKTIGEQADLLWLGGPSDGPEQAPPVGNLVMFTPEQQDDNDAAPEAPMDRPKMESSIGRRFDIIRATASQATWALRDINEIIREARNMALDIAQTTSTEALDITSDLLEQSENLRYMLDSLVHKMRDQLLDNQYGDGEAPYSDGKTAERKDQDIS